MYTLETFNLLKDLDEENVKQFTVQKSKRSKLNEGHWRTTDNFDKVYVDDPGDRYDPPAYKVIEVWHKGGQLGGAWLRSRCLIDFRNQTLAKEIEKTIRNNLADDEEVEIKTQQYAVDDCMRESEQEQLEEGKILDTIGKVGNTIVDFMKSARTNTQMPSTNDDVYKDKNKKDSGKPNIPCCWDNWGTPSTATKKFGEGKKKTLTRNCSMIETIEDESEYTDELQGYKYAVHCFDFYEPDEYSMGGAESYGEEKFNEPRQAIECWFKMNDSHPTCVAIFTNSQANEEELLRWVVNNEYEFNRIYNRHKKIYKLEGLIDACKNYSPSKYNYRDGIPDQIYPFCYG